MKQVIEVENIKCEGCMKSIHSALSKLDGIENIQIDKQLEKIEYEGTIERNVVVDALLSLGYPEKGNNDLFAKAKSYVSCAIGKMK